MLARGAADAIACPQPFRCSRCNHSKAPGSREMPWSRTCCRYSASLASPIRCRMSASKFSRKIATVRSRTGKPPFRADPSRLSASHSSKTSVTVGLACAALRANLADYRFAEFLFLGG